MSTTRVGVGGPIAGQGSEQGPPPAVRIVISFIGF